MLDAGRGGAGSPPRPDPGAAVSPGVDGQKGLRLQFNSRQSTVDTGIPLSARHFEYSTEYLTYIPCRQTAICWPTVKSGAWCGHAPTPRGIRSRRAGVPKSTFYAHGPSNRSRVITIYTVMSSTWEPRNFP
eukprot:58850-Pyramimonas_sp.AAC.1